MRKVRYIGIALMLTLLVIYIYLIQDYQRTPPTMYTNAHMITLDEESPTAEAMLVKDGVITAIGSHKEVEALQGSGVQIVDMKGAVVMPGFVDPHTHFALSMVLSGMHDLSGFKHDTNDDVWASLEKAAATTEEDMWILGKGIDPILVPDLKTPSLRYLDSIAPDNPILLLSQSLHNYWVNTRAFEKAGITRETPDPSLSSFYEKDAEGELTGHIVEQEAIGPIMKLIEAEVFTPDFFTGAADQVMLDYAKNGNTTIISTGLTINDTKPLILLKHLSEERSSMLGNILEKIGRLPKRHPNPRHFIYMRHDRTHLLPETRIENNFYNIIGVKHWMDGSPYIGTMYLDSAYQESELTNDLLHIPRDHRGEGLIGDEELRNFIKQYHNDGWQIAIHSQGDVANREVIDAFEEVNQAHDIRAARHRLEHCLLLPRSELDRMKTMNMTPSFHVNHLYFYGDALRDDLLGEERVNKILPVAATEEEGIKYSLHADQPMFASRPFRLIQTAVERKTKSGDLIGVDQRVELLQAIKAMTINAAWQIKMDDKIGSLEKGKYADFIVLDKNPFELATGELENIRCLRTFVNGNEVIGI